MIRPTHKGPPGPVLFHPNLPPSTADLFGCSLTLPCSWPPWAFAPTIFSASDAHPVLAPLLLNALTSFKGQLPHLPQSFRFSHSELTLLLLSGLTTSPPFIIVHVSWVCICLSNYSVSFLRAGATFSSSFHSTPPTPGAHTHSALLSENSQLQHLGHSQSLLPLSSRKKETTLPCWFELNQIEYSQQQCGLK